MVNMMKVFWRVSMSQQDYNSLSFFYKLFNISHDFLSQSQITPELFRQ
jgi:hypothetical protein